MNNLFLLCADALMEALASDPAVTISAGLIMFSMLATILTVVLAIALIWAYCCLLKGELGPTLGCSTHALDAKIAGALGM